MSLWQTILGFSRCKWEVLSMRREQQFGWTEKHATPRYENLFKFMTYNGNRDTLDTEWHTFIRFTNKNHGHKDTHTHSLMEVQGFLTFWAGAWACQLLECDSSTHTANTHIQPYMHTDTHAYTHTAIHAHIRTYSHTCTQTNAQDTNFTAFHLTSN